MNRNKALLLLGADDNTDATTLTDKLEDAVFGHASYFLKRAFLPKLAEIKKVKLQELMAVGDVLNLTPTDQLSSFTFNDQKRYAGITTLSELLIEYHHRESLIKTSIANAVRADFAHRTYSQWIYVFRAFAERFIEMYETSEFYTPADASVKQSQHVDMMLIINELNSNNSHKPELHKLYSWLCKL